MPEEFKLEDHEPRELSVSTTFGRWIEDAVTSLALRDAKLQAL